MSVPDFEDQPRLDDVLEGAAIILEGWFNPGIIHPHWFVTNGIIGEEEGEWALDIDAGRDPRTSSEFSEFEVPEFTFSCQRVRLRVASRTNMQNPERLAKVVKATLTVLPHMPVRVLLLNRSVHLPDEGDRWHQLATGLVPDPQQAVPDGELASLTFRRGPSDTLLEVTIEESHRIERGTFISVIERLEFKPDPSDLGGNRAIAVVEERWDALLEEAGGLIRNITELA